MKLFLCGGGSGEKTTLAMKKFSELIDKTKPLLYVPLAMKEERYPSCLEWISEEVKSINIKKIDMVKSKEELEEKNFEEYCAVFIGGGNTYKLLKDLKDSLAFEKLKEFIENDGVVFGGSAGAIIFGSDIDTCKYEDDNETVKLRDTKGFNVLNDFSLLCHFDKKEEQTKINEEYLIKFSKNNKILYLPEEDTIFINGKDIELIGNEKYLVFENNNKDIIDPNKINIKEIIN